jgi:hypothetical protein
MNSILFGCPSHVPTGIGENWFLFNDDDVQSISSVELIGTATLDETEKMYMWFYERTDTIAEDEGDDEDNAPDNKDKTTLKNKENRVKRRRMEEERMREATSRSFYEKNRYIPTPKEPLPAGDPVAPAALAGPPPLLAVIDHDVLAPMEIADVPQAIHEGNVFENRNGNVIAEEVVESPPLQIHSSGKPVRNRQRADRLTYSHPEAKPRTVSVKKRVVKRARPSSPTSVDDAVDQVHQHDDDSDYDDNDHDGSVSSMSTQENEFV